MKLKGVQAAPLLPQFGNTASGPQPLKQVAERSPQLVAMGFSAAMFCSNTGEICEANTAV